MANNRPQASEKRELFGGTAGWGKKRDGRDLLKKGGGPRSLEKKKKALPISKKKGVKKLKRACERGRTGLTRPWRKNNELASGSEGKTQAVARRGKAAPPWPKQSRKKGRRKERVSLCHVERKKTYAARFEQRGGRTQPTRLLANHWAAK